MNAATYATYRFRYSDRDLRPNQCITECAIRTGSRPAAIVAHPTELDLLRFMVPETVNVASLPVGGPLPGEIWIEVG